MTEDIDALKKQLKELEARIDYLKDFTIDEIAKTRLGILKENKNTDKENQERGVVY
jgi:cell division protein FtsB